MSYNKKKIKLRYGENPNQSAYLISNFKKSVFDFQLGGKGMSYNNLLDLDSGLRCLQEFKEPTSIIVKHTNPCGVASAKSITDAFIKAYNCDPKSSFGGIIFLNRRVDLNLAKKIFKNFFELVVAPNFDKNALDVLKNKKNLILLKIPNIKKERSEYKSTLFGTLHQTTELTPIKKNFMQLSTVKKASKQSLEDLIFSLKVVKHLKSNAIVLSKNKQTIGLGHGQTSRVDALKYALKNKNKYFKKKFFVCASDGFFPFTDSIKILNRNGCSVIAQPSGSINDKKIVTFCNHNKISLYFIKNRLFKH